MCIKLLLIFSFHACSATTFFYAVQEITPSFLSRMVHTWRPDSLVPIENLRVVTVSHYDFNGNIKTGQMVVHQAVVDDVVYIFEKLFAAQFPITSIKLVDDFEGSDLKSMQANNTSAFYARKVAGTDRWSNHSFGCAIDINPLINPYSSPRLKVSPPESEPYLDRSIIIPGMIIKGSYIYNLFIERGWEWGGECFFERDGVVDRHHFQKVISGINQNTN